MANLDSNRIMQTFAELRGAGKKTLAPFITAGHPDVETTEALLKDFESRGVRMCELGVPFSDPIADGPVIQNSYTQALEAGITSESIFETVRRYRSSGGEMALLAMVSYSIVYRHGVQKYLKAAHECGFDGVIIPDLSLEEAPGVEAIASGSSLANVMLIAPNTPAPRRLEIAQHSRGFIYFISITGITGERDTLPPETIRTVAELRTHTDTPICVGFGISNADMVKGVCEVADGAIVGSAIVHRINDAKDLPRDQLVAKVGDFIAELLEPLK